MSVDLPDTLIPDLPDGCRPFTLDELKRQPVTRRIETIQLYEIGSTLDKVIETFTKVRDQYAQNLQPGETFTTELDGPDYEGGYDSITINHFRYETDDEVRTRLNQIARQRIAALTRKLRRKPGKKTG